MNNDKLEAVRQKCIEANPNIKDLKFGCYFTVNPSHDEIHIASWETIGGNWVSANDAEEYDIGEIEIIGRKIALADVLLAIQGKHVGIQSNGCFIRLNPFNEENKYSLCDWYSSFEEQYHSYKWDLKNNDLSLQPQETIDFLHSLLC